MPYITRRKIGHANKNREQDTKRHNDRWNMYYQKPAWKKLRDYYMRLCPICEMCMFEGRSVPAEHCHHKIPFSQGTTEEEKIQLLLDPDNLQALCSMHHHIVHQNLKHQNQ